MAYITEKYDYHIANIGHNTLILCGNIDLILIHIYAKTDPTATCTSQVITLYVPEANVPTPPPLYVIYSRTM